MGMQQKLERARQVGFNEGQKKADEFAELRGVVKGATQTWELMENMFLEIHGIGPKTKEKILKHVQQYAQQEKRKLEHQT